MKLPVVSGREAVSALEHFGFELQPKRGKGSHMVLWSEQRRKMITIPDHKELDRGTLRAILRHADITPEEFAAML